MQSQEKLAAQELRRRFKTEHVRGMHMDLRVHERRARVVVAPGYHITYTYGEHQLGSLEIRRLAHEAFVPASARAGAIVAERHVSPRKAQAAAAAAVLVVKGAAAAASGGAASAAQLAASIATVDTAFYAFIAASAAGLAARSLTALLRERHAAQIESRADAMRDAYMRGGMAAGSVESEHDLWLRADLEWHRWAEAEREEWHADKRRAWAERLFREQHLRRCVALVRKATPSDTVLSMAPPPLVAAVPCLVLWRPSRTLRSTRMPNARSCCLAVRRRSKMGHLRMQKSKGAGAHSGCGGGAAPGQAERARRAPPG